MRSLQLLASVALVLGLACTRAAPPPPPPPPPPIPASPPSPAPAAASPDGPQAELDRLDTRAPLPLLPRMAAHQKQNMRDHLAAVQEIVAALASDDFDAVARAASRIGFSEQMGMMCTHMGAGAADFTPTALRFHHTADTIAEAARARDARAVLAALGATLGTCTGCHATWKQQVVDEGAWSRATGAAPPQPGAHAGH